MQPDLSIVFVNYNSTRYLESALESLRRNPPESSVELLVVDNASRDRDELARVCSAAGARLIRLRRNVGYGAAANQGFKQACGRYVAVANTDIEFTAGAVNGIVRFLDDCPDAGVVAPQLLYPDLTLHPTARRFPRLRYALAGRRSLLRRLKPENMATRRFLYGDVGPGSQPVAVESVVGTFCVFRREALEQSAGFDERFFMFAEDVDICRRIGRSWRVFLLPGAKVVHAVGQARRRSPAFSEFHRIRSHRLFVEEGASWPARLLVDLAAAAYLALLLSAGMLGLGEHEYTWRSAGRNRR